MMNKYLTPRERFALAAPPPPEDWYNCYPDPPGKPVRPDNDVLFQLNESHQQQAAEYFSSSRRWHMKRAAEAAAAWAWAYADAALEAQG